jgi:hypothetical protein
MRINELLTEQSQVDEGIGDLAGRAAGHVVGAAGKAGRGLSGAWQDAKAGYAAAKGAWDPKDKTAVAPGATDPTATDPAASGVANASSVGGAGQPTGGGNRPYVAPAAARTAPGAATTAPNPGTAGNISDIMKTIDALDRPSKQQLAGELAKSIAAKPAAPKPTAAPNPAAGAFGQMAGQLKAMAPPEQSSTGGTTQQTATGQVHTANPTNPNRAPAAAPVAAPVAPAATTPAPVRTGGTVAGQVSQTPNAIRKRDARAATTPVAEFRSNFLGRMI